MLVIDGEHILPRTTKAEAFAETVAVTMQLESQAGELIPNPEGTDIAYAVAEFALERVTWIGS